MTREHLEEDRAEGVDVGARVDVVAARLLRRHVLRRAERFARRREARASAGGLGEAEVEQHGAFGGLVGELARAVGVGARRALAGEEDVGRLQIAVDDALVVGERERVRDLFDDAERLGEGERAGREP
ncbi:MAG: hypothetical protein R3B99_35020 [Polyangiales bacterium]